MSDAKDGRAFSHFAGLRLVDMLEGIAFRSSLGDIVALQVDHYGLIVRRLAKGSLAHCLAPHKLLTPFINGGVLPGIKSLGDCFSPSAPSGPGQLG